MPMCIRVSRKSTLNVQLRTVENSLYHGAVGIYDGDDYYGRVARCWGRPGWWYSNTGDTYGEARTRDKAVRRLVKESRGERPERHGVGYIPVRLLAGGPHE